MRHSTPPTYEEGQRLYVSVRLNTHYYIKSSKDTGKRVEKSPMTQVECLNNRNITPYNLIVRLIGSRWIPSGAAASAGSWCIINVVR